MQPFVPSHRLELAINAPALLDSSPHVEEIERVQKLTKDEITQWLARKREERLAQMKAPDVLPTSIVYRPAPLDPDFQNAAAIQLVARRIDAQLKRTRSPVSIPEMPASIEQMKPEPISEIREEEWKAPFIKALQEKELLRESD